MKKIFIFLCLLMFLSIPFTFGQQSKRDIMLSIYGEPGYARSNDGLTFRACSVHGLIGPSSGGFPIERPGQAEKNKNCITVSLTLPQEANELSREELFIFATMAESDHWRDVGLNDYPAYGGWSASGNLDVYQQENGQWVVKLDFCNWASKQRKASITVLYTLSEKAKYTRVAIDSSYEKSQNKPLEK